MSSLENRFNKLKADTSGNIWWHLDTLRNSVKEGDVVVELGVCTGISSTAFLIARPKKQICYDIEPQPMFWELQEIAKEENIDLEYIIANDLTVEIPECDILFIDSWHTYPQLQKELELHGNKAKRLIIFHDTYTFGEVGEDGTTPALNQAIKEFLEVNTHWSVDRVWTENNGLTILKRA